MKTLSISITSHFNFLQKQRFFHFHFHCVFKQTMKKEEEKWELFFSWRWKWSDFREEEESRKIYKILLFFSLITLSFVKLVFFFVCFVMKWKRDTKKKIIKDKFSLLEIVLIGFFLYWIYPLSLIVFVVFLVVEKKFQLSSFW